MAIMIALMVLMRQMRPVQPFLVLDSGAQQENQENGAFLDQTCVTDEMIAMMGLMN